MQAQENMHSWPITAWTGNNQAFKRRSQRNEPIWKGRIPLRVLCRMNLPTLSTKNICKTFRIHETDKMRYLLCCLTRLLCHPDVAQSSHNPNQASGGNQTPPFRYTTLSPMSKQDHSRPSNPLLQLLRHAAKPPSYGGCPAFWREHPQKCTKRSSP